MMSFLNPIAAESDKTMILRVVRRAKVDIKVNDAKRVQGRKACLIIRDFRVYNVFKKR